MNRTPGPWPKPSDQSGEPGPTPDDQSADRSEKQDDEDPADGDTPGTPSGMAAPIPDGVGPSSPEPDSEGPTKGPGRMHTVVRKVAPSTWRPSSDRSRRGSLPRSRLQSSCPGEWGALPSGCCASVGDGGLGGQAGLDGSAPVPGSKWVLTPGAASSFGLDAAAVALLGRSRPLGTDTASDRITVLSKADGLARYLMTLVVWAFRIAQRRRKRLPMGYRGAPSAGAALLGVGRQVSATACDQPAAGVVVLAAVVALT